MKNAFSIFAVVFTAFLVLNGCTKEEENPATCTDGIQNGTETGVDCGGSCSPCFDDCGTVMDVDGNVYNTVVIGNQCWTRENLKVTRFRDNTPIPNETSQSFWANLQNDSDPAYCIYNNDPAKDELYGKPYNWFAVSSGQLCPQGYRVPTNQDWADLISYLGGESEASNKLRAINLDLWGQFDDATNSSGFSALPGGLRTNQGDFRYNEGSFAKATFWSLDQQDQYWGLVGAWMSDNILVRGSERKNAGMSCRCIKENGSTVPSCNDGIQNGQETGVDCGGPDCDPCNTGNDAMTALINGAAWSTDEAIAQDLGQLGPKIKGNLDGFTGQGILIDLGEYNGP